ncbi:MAG TPA: hypothetical protein VF970_12400 [Gemmatimonadales bacterium]
MSNRLTAGAPVLCAALAASLFPSVGWSQVGHRPEGSPFRDLQVRHALLFQGGYLSGSGGRAAAGPTDGPMVGLRYTIHLGGPWEAIFGAAGADLQRVVHSPGLAPDTVGQSVLMGETGFAFLLTGEKSWHGLVPYVAATMGAAFGGSVPADSTSGYQFQTKFHFGPQVGVRWYTTRRISLRLEGRDVMWRLRYPASFFDLVPGSLVIPPLLPGFDPDREWTHNLSLTLALGFAIRH